MSLLTINVIRPTAYILKADEFAEQHLERCGRTCYKSEDRISEGSAAKFVSKICRNNHESVLEHASMTVRFVCSRACSHQLVRHRIAAYSQESQRYVNYQKRGYEVIVPPSWEIEPGEYTMEEFGGYDGHGWSPRRGRYLAEKEDGDNRLGFLAYSFEAYEEAIRRKMKPEDARYFLPNASKTEIVATYNFRTWRHLFRERALNSHAQWEIRGLMDFVFHYAVTRFPSVFEDLKPNE